MMKHAVLLRRVFTVCVFVLFVLFHSAVGQEILSERIKGLRVTGDMRAGVPVVVQGSKSITIEFDSNDEYPADFRIKFYHCDKNWQRTVSSFVNDDIRNMTKSPLPYDRAPAGTQHYQWHYTVRLPGHGEVQTFEYSGNYVFEIWDENREQVLARGRFFVAERTIAAAMRIANRRDPSTDHPRYMVNQVDVQFSIPEFITRTGRKEDAQPSPNGQEQEVMLPLFFTTVDVYKNREISRRNRIDINDRSSSTFVEGIGTRRLKFTAYNVQPGNEYRRLDLRNVSHYPAGTVLRQREGADISRMLFKAPRDNNGLSTLTRGDRYADYVQVQFEYLVEPKDSGDRIYVVGDFNGWQANDSSMMTYDAGTKRFILITWLRRGLYDYQYILNDDWIALEGNDWRTINVYSAFIYYNDDRYGGFDRIVGFVQGQSSGQNAPTD
ncbi:MAG: DUF5103 domain-containing protein [Ignavibacteriae bacterium]|nr:DUF5103 domain-containing protein [Ignavibacteriota bacterium]